MGDGLTRKDTARREVVRGKLGVGEDLAEVVWACQGKGGGVCGKESDGDGGSGRGKERDVNTKVDGWKT